MLVLMTQPTKEEPIAYYLLCNQLAYKALDFSLLKIRNEIKENATFLSKFRLVLAFFIAEY